MHDLPLDRKGRLTQGLLALFIVDVMTLAAARVIAAPATQPAPQAPPAVLPANSVPGTIEAHTVQVRPAIDATIKEVNCHDGQSVKRGDVLFQLDDAAARAQVDAAKAEFELADARARTFETVAPGTVSKVEKNVVMAQRRVAAANLVVKEAALDQTRLIAPLDGVVTHCDAAPGEVASRGMPLATVVQVHPLRVRFAVAEGYEALHVGELCGIYNRNTRDQLAAAKVSLISPEDDPSTATEVVVADIDNANGKLKPGMTVVVGLPDEPGNGAVRR